MQGVIWGKTGGGGGQKVILSVFAADFSLYASDVPGLASLVLTDSSHWMCFLRIIKFFNAGLSQQTTVEYTKPAEGITSATVSSRSIMEKELSHEQDCAWLEQCIRFRGISISRQLGGISASCREGKHDGSEGVHTSW